MPKFYISSGDLQSISDQQDAKTAVIAAFRELEGTVDSLGLITLVSETGFSGEDENDVYFSTMDVLEWSNQLENFKSSDWL